MTRFALIFFLITLCACSKKKHDQHKEEVVVADMYYSCPMHPQVKERKPGKCPICNMPLTPVKKPKEEAGEIQLSDQQIQLGNIKVDTIRSGNLNNQTILSAVLNFDQTKTSAVSARVMGRLERLYFKNVGDYIRKGDRLYDLYSEELNNAKEEFILATQSLKSFSGDKAIDFNSLVQSSKNKLRLWGMSEYQIMQMLRSGKATATTTFYSDASGYITSLDVREGDYVMEGGTIAQLADLSTLWVEAQVFTSHFSQLPPNAPVTVRIPERGDETIQGKISFVNPEIVPDSRINLIRVSIPNKGNQLKPGMAAYVYLRGSSDRSTITMPVDAVIRDSKGATVWIKTGENTFKNKMVTVGSEAGGRIEVRDGLVPGDVVVTSGAYLLHSEYIFKKGADPMEGMKM